MSRKIRKFRTDENGWFPAVYMSCMSQNLRLFHVSNLSVRNFLNFLPMYTGSASISLSGAGPFSIRFSVHPPSEGPPAYPPPLPSRVGRADRPTPSGLSHHSVCVPGAASLSGASSGPDYLDRWRMWLPPGRNHSELERPRWRSVLLYSIQVRCNQGRCNVKASAGTYLSGNVYLSELPYWLSLYKAYI